MQKLTTTLLICGALIIGYTFQLLAYLHFRRRAQRNSSGQSGVRVQWWKSICYLMCAGLVIGAAVWIIAIANLFAHLASSWADICPSLIAQDACDRVASDWRNSCEGLVECACAALVIILCVAYVEVKNKESPPERSYPLAILTWSHGLLVLSWILCTPLAFPLEIFNLVGARQWTGMGSSFAIVALLAYIVGTSLWIIACIRISCAWCYRSRTGTPTAGRWYRSTTRTPAEGRWPRRRDSDREIALQDLERYP